MTGDSFQKVNLTSLIQIVQPIQIVSSMEIFKILIDF